MSTGSGDGSGGAPGDHVTNVPDGSGCTEIWEHLSDQREAASAFVRGSLLDVPGEIDSALGRLVWYCIAAAGRVVTVRDLKDALDVSALQLYPVLDQLVDHEFVERAGDYVWPAGLGEAASVELPSEGDPA